ncbi:hypothetical protein D3Z33_09375 [Senegalia massiliensis]|uniref:Uncharacterized protein n=1 Tax=Senegalia massiliensis TaxID=1720316 RepID=A0A845R3F2_9CLOT|nr:hypothetical protein [Senegalia massiliensis]
MLHFFCEFIISSKCTKISKIYFLGYFIKMAFIIATFIIRPTRRHYFNIVSNSIESITDIVDLVCNS